MLIRTIDELEELPDGAIIRDGYETLGEKTADGWQFPCGRDIPSQNVKIPAQLIYPRRYGDDDVERVAEVIQEITGEPRIGRFERTMARAALNALEEK